MAVDRVLRISGDRRLITASFDEWHNTLRQGSEAIGSATQIAGTDVRFRRIPRHKERRHLDFWIGSVGEAAVQLNQPGTAGSENPGTTLAVDARNRRYIVRQGMLTGNPPSDRIDEPEFRRRTGLTPAPVTVGGRPARKEWHVVARLDGASGAAIRDSTAEFVRRCWNARTFGRQAAEDQVRLSDLFGKPERGDWYDVDPALRPTRVLRVQGYVFECLERLLKASDIAIGKPRHAANYEVDGTIETPTGPMLIEIKTGVSAADVYCGVGQLNLYPVVLPDLARHARVLLLPGKPTRHLADALETCGVELHHYDLKRGRRRAAATFTAEFLRRCGVEPQRVADLVARGQALP
jgi:hypothetical protein